ncbi:Spc98 family-domain-containing protein [Xylariales sp. AK1849]|nr:Spc98 family-domain-containing protein [Xylariales sp. AK1849]
MLHEILLSLSGHPSPLLRNDPPENATQIVLSAPERELLRSAGHLSELHCNLISYTSKISSSHSSVICRAVSTAINSVHLASFQRKILEVESEILRKDTSLVGAYNIVPLTAVIGQFSGWIRKLEWLWDLVQFILRKRDSGSTCRGAELMDMLRAELQTGYADIEETALTLIRTAETAWLKQISAWVLYGRLPGFGADDFFIHKDVEDNQGYMVKSELLPSFVTSSSVSSMLFIGTSLNRVRARSTAEPTLGGLGHISSQLQGLSSLTFPLSSAALSRAITSVRLDLSRTVLQKLLPLEKVLEMLHVLRHFMLLGRGEFAMALTQQADERIRSRWRRADNLAYEKRDGLGTVILKEGEVAAVLARSWAVLGSMQGQHAEEDEELELARVLLQLNLSKSREATPMKPIGQATEGTFSTIATTPFRNLLLSVPVVMTVRIPSPLDLFLTSADVQIYSSINSYLLSIRRAHLRLTDLWKISSLRRHYPPPPKPPYSGTKDGMTKTQTLRQRWSARSSTMRSTWTTSSAAIFLLAEIEAYLQVEVVEGLWQDFHSWLTRNDGPGQDDSSKVPTSGNTHALLSPEQSDGDDDVWLQGRRSSRLYTSFLEREVGTGIAHHDPQTLSSAHRLYIRVLSRRILLTRPTFTEPLYNLLIHIDHLVALIYRLNGIWTSMDLETDEGVVDAFSNLEAEEVDVKSNLRGIESKVKKGVEDVVSVLRNLSVDSDFLAEMEDDGMAGADEELLDDEDVERYTPKRIGGVDRLLMKLAFGGWFDTGRVTEGAVGDGDHY